MKSALITLGLLITLVAAPASLCGDVFWATCGPNTCCKPGAPCLLPCTPIPAGGSLEVIAGGFASSHCDVGVGFCSVDPNQPPLRCGTAKIYAVAGCVGQFVLSPVNAPVCPGQNGAQICAGF